MNPDSKYKLPYRSFIARPEGLGAKGAPFFKAPKLTSTQRMEIGYRRHEGERAIDLAAEYGVSRALIDTCTKLPRP